MPRHIILITFWVGVFGAVPTSLADHRELPRPTPRLRLSELIEEAVNANANLAATREEATAAEAAAGPAGALEDPMLSLEAMNYPVDTLSRRQSEMTGNQISLSQKIPFPGKLGSRSESARLEADARKAEAENAKLQLIGKVKGTYYELFASFRKLDILNEQKNLLDQLITVTRNNYSVGKAPQAEVLNLQVEQAVLVEETLVAERQIKHLFGELSHLLGRSDHAVYLQGRPEDISRVKFDFAKHSQKAITERATASNPELKANNYRIASTREGVSLARKKWLPDLEVKLGYMFREPSPMDPGTDFVSGMLGVSVPLWSLAQASDERRSAQAEKARAEALAREKRVELAHRIHVLYSELEEASKRVELYEGGLLPFTRQAVVSGHSAYATGKLGYATLLDLIKRRFQMETSYASALANLATRVAELEAIVGEPLGG